MNDLTKFPIMNVYLFLLMSCPHSLHYDLRNEGAWNLWLFTFPTPAQVQCCDTFRHYTATTVDAWHNFQKISSSCHHCNKLYRCSRSIILPCPQMHKRDYLNTLCHYDIPLVWQIWCRRWWSRRGTVCTRVTSFCDSGFTASSQSTTFILPNQVNSSCTLVYPCTMSNTCILLFTT